MAVEIRQTYQTILKQLSMGQYGINYKSRRHSGRGEREVGWVAWEGSARNFAGLDSGEGLEVEFPSESNRW